MEDNMALTNRILITFKYLWETTDESHPVSLADISAFLKQHEITADPRTLRRDIEQLIEFGVDIVKDRRVQNLYHVATRHFEAPEVKLLIDAVQSARFITPRKSNALVNRLSSFVAPGDTALLYKIKNRLCDKNIEELKISNKKRAIPIIFKENKYSSVREASRKTGICQWTIRKYGREVMPNE